MAGAKMAEIPIEIIAGNNTPVRFRLTVKGPSGTPVPMDLTGSEMVLTIGWKDGRIVKSSADGGLAVTPLEGLVVWTPTVAESRALPVPGFGRKAARYELERRVPGGEQRTYVGGPMTPTGGISGD